MLVSDIPLRASHPRRRLMRIQPIALEDSSDPLFTDDGVDEASELHFLPPAPDSPVPSLCETSREEATSPVFALSTSPCASPEMTFDVFMSELEEKADSAPLKPASPFETRFHMRVSIVRRQAAQRELQRFRRHQAAATIQRWYLRSITALKARRALESELNKHMATVKEIQAARRVAKAVRRFAEMRRGAKREVWRRYRELCAVLVQKWVRGWLVRRRQAQARRERYARVKWLVLGLKVRKVLRLPALQALKQRVVNCSPEESQSLHEAFISAFALHLQAPWKPPAPIRPFLQRFRGRKEAQRPAPLSPEPTARSVSSSWSGVRPRQQSVCSGLARQPEKTLTARRGNTLISQKPTWKKAKSRVDCWSSPKKATPPDFPKAERTNRKKIPIPLSERDETAPDSSNTTAAPSVAEACSQSSLIPRLLPCSSFITSLRTVDCKELLDIRRLLQEAFEIIKRG